MDNLNEYVLTALQIGFTAAAPFDASRLVCQPDIRMLCAPDKCMNYGTNWICPPGCGELPNCAARLSKYRFGLLVQSKYEKINSNDFPLMKKLAVGHNQRLQHLKEIIAGDYPDAFLLSTGRCELCEKCTYPAAPCRKPALFRGALSAYGIDVSDLCASVGIEFSFIPGTLRYVACVLV